MVVEDHRVVRQGLVQLLNQEQDLLVVCEVGDQVSAMRAVRQQALDLVLVDITLDGSNGLSLTRSLVAEWPELPVLVLSMHDEKVYGERAFRAGAVGYVMKDQPWEHLLRAIRAALSGQLAFSRSLARTLLSPREGPESGAQSLSDREIEVFALLGRGLRLREVAERLNLSPKTIESHVASIKRKLGIEHANELIHRATLYHHLREEGSAAAELRAGS